MQFCRKWQLFSTFPLFSRLVLVSHALFFNVHTKQAQCVIPNFYFEIVIKNLFFFFLRFRAQFILPNCCYTDISRTALPMDKQQTKWIDGQSRYMFGHVRFHDSYPLIFGDSSFMVIFRKYCWLSWIITLRHIIYICLNLYRDI